MKTVDLTGRVFGRLTVVDQDGLTKSGHKRWRCKCDCGNDYSVRGTLLTQEQVVSCGCYRKEQSAERPKTHGYYYRVSYKHWAHMMDRCYNERNGSYKRYGARGIKVCDRWQDYLNFAADMGEPPSEGLSLDRIDFNGDYRPENCRWATMREQANNRSSNYWVEYNDERKSLSDWSGIYGIKPATLQKRLEKGMSFEEAVTTPVRHTRRNEWIEYGGERRTMTQWAGKYGLGVTTLVHRLRAGWSIHDALTKPVEIHKGINDFK